jgi:RNA polymerase sigma-70 factor (ECF subfamily)
MVPERPLDAETVAKCHRDYAAMLERYAWAIVRDWSLAADAVQNGFVALARFGADVVPEARKNWLFRVVHREAMRLRQKQQRHYSPPEELDALRERPAKYEISGVEKLQQQEMVEALHERLQQLPIDQQRVLQMRIYDDKTFAEIAE